MARNYASTDTSIWSDDNWRALPRSAQWTYQLLWEQPKLSLAGQLELKVKQWARCSSDITADQLLDDLEVLEQAGWIAIDHDTDELIIRNFVARDRTAKNRNSGKGMWNSWRAIESNQLRQIALEDMPAEAFKPEWEPPMRPPSEPRFEPLSEPPTPIPSPVPNSSSPVVPTADPHEPVDNITPPATPTGDEDEDPRQQLIHRIAHRVVERRQANSKTTITNPDRWRATVLTSLRNDPAWWTDLERIVDTHMPDTPIDLLAQAADGNPSPNLRFWRDTTAQAS